MSCVIWRGFSRVVLRRYRLVLRVVPQWRCLVLNGRYVSVDDTKLLTRSVIDAWVDNVPEVSGDILCVRLHGLVSLFLIIKPPRLGFQSSADKRKVRPPHVLLRPGAPTVPEVCLSNMFSTALSVTNDMHKLALVIEGLAWVAELICRYAVTEALYMQSASKVDQGLERAVVKLYASILGYLSKAKQYFEQGTASQCTPSKGQI
jgi:hypothetical protein